LETLLDGQEARRVAVKEYTDELDELASGEQWNSEPT
jgi:hypothetical protein